MKGRFSASMAMQQPSGLPAYDVCPHCKRETPMFLETRDGKAFEVYRCPMHGDVVSMRSAVVNHGEAVDWSAA